MGQPPPPPPPPVSGGGSPFAPPPPVPARPGAGRGLGIALIAVLSVVALAGTVGAGAAVAGWLDRDHPVRTVAAYYDAARRGDCAGVLAVLSGQALEGVDREEAGEECRRDLERVGGRLPVDIDGLRVVDETVDTAVVEADVTIASPDSGEPVTGPVHHLLHREDGFWRQSAPTWLPTRVRGLSPPGTLVPEPPGPGPSPEPSGPVELQLWHRYADAPAETVWGDLAEAFVDGRDEVTVEVTGHPPPDYDVALEAMTAAGEAPELFMTSAGWTLREQVRQGLVMDLTDVLADVIGTLSPASLAPYTVDGRVYGIPHHAGATGLWYNRSLFADAGLDPDDPPVTWGEFMTAVARLDAEGTTPIALAGEQQFFTLFWYANLALRLAGPDGIDAAIDAQSFEDPSFEEAAGLLAELAAQDPFQPGFEAALWAAGGGSAEVFAGGGAAMDLMGGWAPSVYQTMPGGPSLGDDLGWFPFPGVGSGAGDTVLGDTVGFAVAADAPPAALDFLRFLHDDPENFRQLQEADPTMLPPRPGAGPAASRPELAPLRDAVDAATALRVPFDQELPDAVAVVAQESVTGLILGRLSPEEAVARITDAYQREPAG